MLQLNHVTIRNKDKLLLDDCTFQFKEGQVYVIVGDTDDFIAFFKCVCDEIKPESGQIITWDGAQKFNSCDDEYMPEPLTVRQYISGLALVKGIEIDTDDVLDKAEFDMAYADSAIKRLDDTDRAKLRLAAMKLTDAYICIFGEPLPDIKLISEWVRDVKDDKVIMFGVSDEDTAQELVYRAEAQIIRFGSGGLQ